MNLDNYLRAAIFRFSLAMIFFSFFAAHAEPVAPEPETGAALVQQIRSLQPEGDSTVSGVLKIRSDKWSDDVPVTCKVVTTNDSWQVSYETAATAKTGAEKFVVIHSLNSSNKYLYARAENAKAPLPQLKTLSSHDIAIPLAGSDFWLSELAFDFLEWPQQEKLKGEMKLGQPCYVLESRNPQALKIARVKSWIHKESGGVMVANAYDGDNRLIKEYSLAGSSFKKINGRRQLKQMKIGSPQNKSETILEFDLPKD